jgi:pSer/pThr/pTyr-binding forkhead associated (FHA) protein
MAGLLSIVNDHNAEANMSEGNQGNNITRIRPSASPAERILARQQASVVVVKGHAEGMEYLIERASTIIGRDKHAQVRLKDPLVSREHAVILCRDGKITLKDLGSTNGTLINSVSIKEADLHHGDTFRVGDTVLQFVLEDTVRTSTQEIA